ncbi:MAG: Alanine racemase 1 [Alphaproteobacteria bacterium MarineAlpha2_Bin1]|nr:MAG: Alanine racemase 1 [Alphaproteobacteria bacterium MarineAlpha2_Bin1]
MPNQYNYNGTLEIDLDIISNNYFNIKKILKKKVCCAAVVKANAYGLGINKIAKTLFNSGCRVFFVANMIEGVKLRTILRKEKENNRAIIYILHGPSEKKLKEYKNFNLRPVINSFYQLNRWEEYILSANYKSKIAIHIDSGMNRLGLSKNEIEKIKTNKRLLDKFHISLIMSHLSNAEEVDNPLNDYQKEYFDKTARFFPESKKSLANSAATLSDSKFHYDMVRTGIIIYIGSQFQNYNTKLSNSICLKTHIISINEIKEPETVGYGSTFRAKKNTMIATIPVGYADGYLRSLSNSGFAYINNKKVDIIGRISMDLTVINITDVEAEIGTEVILFGPSYNLDDIAASGNTISYELLTNLGNRYKRKYNFKK